MNGNKNHHSSFFAGFILGVAAALLLNSKKGRKILKILIEKSTDSLNEWETITNEVLSNSGSLDNRDDFLITSTPIDQKKEDSREFENNPADKLLNNSSDHSSKLNEVISEMGRPDPQAVMKVKSATRRFFRGIKKKK